MRKKFLLSQAELERLGEEQGAEAIAQAFRDAQSRIEQDNQETDEAIRLNRDKYLAERMFKQQVTAVILQLAHRHPELRDTEGNGRALIARFNEIMSANGITEPADILANITLAFFEDTVYRALANEGRLALDLTKGNPHAHHTEYQSDRNVELEPSEQDLYDPEKWSLDDLERAAGRVMDDPAQIAAARVREAAAGDRSQAILPGWVSPLLSNPNGEPEARVVESPNTSFFSSAIPMSRNKRNK